MLVHESGRLAPATPHVTPDTPEDGADEQARALAEVEKRTFEVKLVEDGGENETGDALDRSNVLSLSVELMGDVPATYCHCPH